VGTVTTDEFREPARDEIELAEVLAALADRARLKLVRTLAGLTETSCTALGEAAGLTCTKSTLSHHMRVLREAGVTRTRVAGTRRLVSLRSDDLDELFPGVLASVVQSAPAPAAAAV